jgi:hypothetical protein
MNQFVYEEHYWNAHTLSKFKHQTIDTNHSKEEVIQMIDTAIRQARDIDKRYAESILNREGFAIVSYFAAQIQAACRIEFETDYLHISLELEKYVLYTLEEWFEKHKDHI